MGQVSTIGDDRSVAVPPPREMKDECVYALREVNVNTMIVDQHALHLEVGLLTVLSMLKLDEGVLKAVARSLFPNDLAREDLAETAEDELEVVVYAAELTLVVAAEHQGKGRALHPPWVTGLSLQTNSTFSGGLTSAKGRSPTISSVRA